MIILYAQWYDKSYLNDTTELINYSCEEEVKTFTAPITGNYVLEAWGAQGGSVSSISSGGKTMPALDGGKGGYSYGVVHLAAGDNVYVVVGCEGKELTNAAKNTTIAGGYNGGGTALSDGTTNNQESGGGATHFAVSNRGIVQNYSSNQNDVLVVAGDGGGSYSSMGIYVYSTGGYGGGLIAGDAVVYYNKSYKGMAGIGANHFIYYYVLKIPGVDQSSHANGTFNYGSFGKGVDAVRNVNGTDGGAGGSWYGGNKLASTSGSGGMAGSGGSGHINTTAIANGKTLAGNLSIPTHDGSSYMTGNTGDGYARISFVNPHYKVKFDANGGTSTMNDQNFVYGTSQNLTNNAFTKTNYAFVGWNTAANGSGTSYTNGQEVNNLSTTEGDEITLYA